MITGLEAKLWWFRYVCSIHGSLELSFLFFVFPPGFDAAAKPHIVVRLKAQSLHFFSPLFMKEAVQLFWKQQKS
jgi:hypothetical protein